MWASVFLYLLFVQRVVVTSGHTRLPVLKGQTIAGVLNTKEFIALLAAGERIGRLLFDRWWNFKPRRHC